MPPLAPLPIDEVLPELLRALSGTRRAVLEAPPGAGKTTRVPVAILDAGLAPEGEVVVVQPRRLAARLSAKRVAEERGERLGETIGYSVRYEDVSGPRTRVRYVTEGVLLRRYLADPTLGGVSVVVLDEFHERQLSMDLLLALARRLQTGARPDLSLCVMSATLDAQSVASYLDDCPRVQSRGRLFPVTVEHSAAPDERPLEKQVSSAVRAAIAADRPGDVLVFLPGTGEIRRAQEALRGLAEQANLLVLPLFGELPLEEQARAVGPADRRKVVLSTNVAETSITIDGVTTVIDSGLARVAEHSAWTGLARLRLGKISRASATQRAGRAGRTRSGNVIRLYTKGDFDTRREHDLPEIRRADLSEMALLLKGSNVGELEALAFLDPPEPAALAHASKLLATLQAVDEQGHITSVGRRMLDFPVQPRLARLIVEGERRGVAREACLFAALLAERDIYARSDAESSRRRESSGSSDLLERSERFEEARRARFADNRLRALGLGPESVRAVDRARQQLERIAKSRAPEPGTDDEIETELGLCVLAAFADRVARRRRRGERELTLASGTSARLSETSVVHEASLLVAVDVEEHQRGTKGGNVLVRIASAIEPEWLLELCPDALSESDELVWNSDTARVERVTRMALGSVVLDESRSPAPASEEAARVLARAAVGSYRERLDALDGLVARLTFLKNAMPELGLEELLSDDPAAILARAAQGRTTLAELAEVDLNAEYLSSLPPTVQGALERNAPERLRLPGGHSTPIHYEPGKPPWIASRLQDFFGMKQVPAVAAGRVSLTLHLLAPNYRPVQVTNDLPSFWDKHYPPLRRELMRRYPRHSWPEDPLTATPPDRTRRTR